MGRKYAGSPGIEVAQDQVGAQLGDIRRDVKALQAGQSALTSSNVTTAEPCTPSFLVGHRAVKEKLRAQFCVNFPLGLNPRKLRTKIIREADCTDQATFEANLMGDVVEITDEARRLGHMDYQFMPLLDYATPYRLAQLVLIGGNEDERQANPAEDPAFDGAPLATFTTPEQFNAPSAPDGSLITYNELDPLTDAHDAHAGLKQYAPLTDAGAAQTYAQAQVDWAESVLARDYGGATGVVREPFRRLLNATELTQVDPLSTPANRGFVVIEAKKLTPGGLYTWVENAVHTAGGTRRTTGSVAFRAGNLITDITQLTNVGIAALAGEPYDGKHVGLALKFTQASPVPVGLRNYTVKRKKSSESAYANVVDRGNRVQADAYHQKHNDGTISVSVGSNIITGVGTKFTRLQAGWEIKVGAQTLVIADTPTSDTLLTTTTNSSTNVASQPYTVVCVVPLVESLKVKPSTTYNVQVILRDRGDNKLTLNLTFTTDADGNVAVDAAAPSALGTPKIKFTPKVGVTISGMTVGGNWNTRQSKEVVIFTDTGGTTYFDIATYLATGGATAQAAANLAAARFRVGTGKEQVTLGIALAAFRSVLGANADVKCLFIATNTVNETQSATSADFFNVATAKDFVNSKFSVNAVTGGAVAIPGKQVFVNGDFFADDGGGNLNRWFMWNGTSFPISGATESITDVTSNVSWDKAIDALKFTTTTKWVIFNLKKGRILPGAKFSLTFQAKSSATPTGLVLRVYFKHDTQSGVNNIDNLFDPSLAYVEVELDGLNTSFQEYGGLLKVKDSPDIATAGSLPLVDQWFAVQLVGTLGGASVWFDKFMFNRGSMPAIFSITEAEEGDIDTLPVGVAAQADVPNIIGNDGGWVGEFGEGGRVERTIQ